MAADGKPIVSLFVISGIMMLIRKVLNLSFVSYDVITCTMFFDCRFQLFLVSKIKKQSATFLGTGFRRVISGILLLIRIVLNFLFISYDLITFIAFFIAGFSSFWSILASKFKSNPASLETGPRLFFQV